MNADFGLRSCKGPALAAAALLAVANSAMAQSDPCDDFVVVPGDWKWRCYTSRNCAADPPTVTCTSRRYHEDDMCDAVGTGGLFVGCGTYLHCQPEPWYVHTFNDPQPTCMSFVCPCPLPPEYEFGEPSNTCWYKSPGISCP